ncbi:trypsin-like peptidase domain-containing protein [Actinopolymorpha sp. B9G3]|uniref:S1C family serine protease n=1 Tax=Actinopolymorpha sp. B9G3 TaxID=3158970 RepID=UPI0032D96BDF
MSETTPSGQPRRPEGTPDPAPQGSNDETAQRQTGPGQPPGGSGGREDTRQMPAYGPPAHHAYGHDSPGGGPAGGPSYGQPYGGPSPNQPPYPPGMSGGHPDKPAPRPRRMAAATVVAVAVAAGLVGGGTGTAATYLLTRDQQATPTATALDEVPRGQNASNAPPGSVQQVADKLLPSVVSIAVASSQGATGGSGIVLSADGLILTNNHVAAPAEQGGEMSVTFSNGRSAKAEVVGLDPTTDLAVIRASGVTDLTPAKLGSSSALSVGQNVVAIGSPLGLSGTVTSGIVSALDRPVRAGDSASSNTVIDAIQTDAAINPGNSGGALVNMGGQVVGINSVIATVGGSMGGQSGSIGVGFAIPIDQARPIAKELIDKGRAEHAQLGVTVSPATSENGTTEGAAIRSITPGGAAADAKLRDGDVITKLGDRRIADADALIAAVRSHRPGEKVTLTFVRDGRTQTASATLGSDGGRAPQQAPEQEQDEGGLPFPLPR